MFKPQDEITHYDRLKLAAMIGGSDQPKVRKYYVYQGTDGKVYQGTDDKVYASKRKGA